jgi:hypothetical protein
VAAQTGADELRDAPARGRRLLIDQFMTHVLQQAARQLAQTPGA